MKYFCFLFVIVSVCARSQNLVPNGSFETYTLCPNGSGQLPNATPWTGPTINSSDYFNACSTVYNVPNYPTGFQTAKDGNAYSGIWFYTPAATDIREYIQVKLVDSLYNNRCYYVEFFANLHDNVKFSTNNIAANLSKVQYTNTGTGFVLNLPQHITQFGNKPIYDTVNWVRIAGIYTATGGEQYLTIGNFKNDSNTDTLRTKTGIYNQAYYFIDAVSVYSINPSGVLPWTYRDTTVNLGDSVYIGNYLGGSFNSNWYLQGGGFIKSGSGIYVKPTVTSNYIVQFTLCGVPHADTLKVTVTTGAGIAELGLKDDELQINPNPNNGVFELVILNKAFTTENTEIKITNVLGQEVKSEKLQSKKQKIDLNDFDKGIYYLYLVNNGTALSVRKIIKQ